MRKTMIAIVLIMMSFSSFGQSCFPNRSLTIGNFMKRLVTEFEYNGPRIVTEIVDGEMSSSSQKGSYFFRSISRGWTVESEFCSGECEQGIETWRMKGSCFLVGGRLARVTRSTTDELRLEVNSGEYILTHHLRLSSGRLSFTTLITGASGSLTTSFVGE